VIYIVLFKGTLEKKQLKPHFKLRNTWEETIKTIFQIERDTLLGLLLRVSVTDILR